MVLNDCDGNDDCNDDNDSKDDDNDKNFIIIISAQYHYSLLIS